MRASRIRTGYLLDKLLYLLILFGVVQGKEQEGSSGFLPILRRCAVIWALLGRALDAQLLHLRLERGALEPQNRGSTTLAGKAPTGSLKNA